MMQKIGRKKFLDLLIGFGGAGTVFVTAWPLLNYLVPPAKRVESGEWIDAGKLAEIKAAGYKDILSSTGLPLILVAGEGDSVTALEKKCPHLGCMVALGDAELDCPCHGAKFTLEGQLISGPSPRGLKRFQVEVRANGSVFVGKEMS